MRNAVPILGLLPMDRLEPCPALVDVADLGTKPLPLPVVFWRRHFMRTRVTNKVLHRNPLLTAPLLDAVEVIMLTPCTLCTLVSFCAMCQISAGGRLKATPGESQALPWRLVCGN